MARSEPNPPAGACKENAKSAGIDNVVRGHEKTQGVSTSSSLPIKALILVFTVQPVAIKTHKESFSPVAVGT